MCWAGAVGGPVYTTASIPCDWAGAEVQKPLAKQMVMDRQTDGRYYVVEKRGVYKRVYKRGILKKGVYKRNIIVCL